MSTSNQAKMKHIRNRRKGEEEVRRQENKKRDEEDITSAWYIKVLAPPVAFSCNVPLRPMHIGCETYFEKETAAIKLYETE